MLLDLLDGALADRFGAAALDELTYGELHEGALRVAAMLSKRGVRAGDRVAVYSENRHGFIYAYLAALRMGAIAVPVNVLYRSTDLAHVLDDSEPSAVITSRPIGVPSEIDVAEVEHWAESAGIATVENLYDDSLSTDKRVSNYVGMLRYDTEVIVKALGGK